VYLGHLLEHLRWEDQLLDALTEVRRVTRTGGRVMVVGPDITKAVAQKQPEWLLEAIIGGAPASSPGGHQWVATEGLTVQAMQRGGLCDVTPVDVATVVRPEWPNVSQASWQCAVTATVKD
jgi:predicted SAM-dependent methyltransferase